jgi:large subunit ribosomal protein L29
MKFKELKEISVKELELKLRQNREEQMALTVKKSVGQLEKPHTLKLLRKDAARIKTALRQHELKAKAEKKASAKPEVKVEAKAEVKVETKAAPKKEANKKEKQIKKKETK